MYTVYALNGRAPDGQHLRFFSTHKWYVYEACRNWQSKGIVNVTVGTIKTKTIPGSMIDRLYGSLPEFVYLN